MRKKYENLYAHIPEYPVWSPYHCVALAAGYLKSPFTKNSVEKGLAKFEKDLQWATLRTDRFIIKEANFPVQEKSMAYLKSMGLEYSKPRIDYLTKIKAQAEEGK